MKCQYQCGAETESPEQSGWTWLPVARAWRCGACEKALGLPPRFLPEEVPTSKVEEVKPGSDAPHNP